MRNVMRVLLGLAVASSVSGYPTLVFGAEAAVQEQEIASLKAQLRLFKSQLTKKVAEVKKLRNENQILKDENQQLRKELKALKPAPEVEQQDGKQPARKIDDKWNGFRGITWGQDIKTTKGMVLVETSDNGRTKFYRKQGDPMKIGEAELSSTVYYFYKGEFAGVMIHSKGLQNWSSLKRAVLARFGDGSKSEYADTWWWSKTFTPNLNCGECVVYLSYNQFSKEGSLSLYSASQKARRQVDDEAAAEKAKDDF